MHVAKIPDRPAIAGTGGHVHNAEIADLFNRYAALLEMQGENPFRIRAYHNAARTLENLPRDVNQMIGEGADLAELPGIGRDLAPRRSPKSPPRAASRRWSD